MISRIIILIATLDSGGAERVVSSLASYWAINKKEILIITLDGSKEDFYSLDRRVKRKILTQFANSNNIFLKSLNYLKKILILRKEIENYKPQLVLSFITDTNILSVLACLFSDYPVFISERINPNYHKISFIKNIIRRFVYKFSNQLIVQTKEISDFFSLIIDKSNISIIPNHIGIEPMSRSNLTNKKIIFVGRLVEQKSVDTLIKAYSLIYRNNKNWTLDIYGDGPKKKFLTSFVKKLDLEKYVKFKELSKNISEIYQSSTILILPSSYEGFPNVLIEAMSYGLVVISSENASSGIIKNNVNGLMFQTGNYNQLANIVENLLNNEKLIKNLSSNALQVSDDFSIETISEMWESMFAKVLFR